MSPESDHAMLARVRRARFSDLPAVVRDCDRVLEQPVGGRWAPGPLVPGVVVRCVSGRGRGPDSGVARRRRAPHGLREVADPSCPGGPGSAGGEP